MNPFATVADKALEATVVLSFSKVGYLARRRLEHWRALDSYDLTGRTALVTGATSGLGLVTATELARLGARVHLLGRSEERTARAADTIRRDSGNDDVAYGLADLSSLEQADAFTQTFLADHDRLDVLVHNAGALVHAYHENSPGLEVTVASHVVAPFLVTTRLLPLLQSTPDSRVITVSSGGMYSEKLDVGHLMATPEHFDGVKAYARAKRAQVVLNEQWARRFGSTGVAFHAMHPGWADTPGVVDSLPTFHKVMGPVLRTPAEGADTIVWLAADDEPLRSNGEFWLDRTPRWTVKLPWTSAPDGEPERLWRWVVDKAGVDPAEVPPPARRH
ncbi:MAG: SDR family NAD(P)-dependent oxidoreductase [Acidimicrobiales bacterium]|jgi:NAD(P)-dependent dehydrogenase (short-subunit alcohol dehydrogenase family)|nr:SDR family NAD(P)-dependent oxidoreductase [Acidimicrobiales bacterium]